MSTLINIINILTAITLTAFPSIFTVKSLGTSSLCSKQSKRWKYQKTVIKPASLFVVVVELFGDCMLVPGISQFVFECYKSHDIEQ